MFKRMSILLAMLLIGALMATAEEVACGDLSAADCQILIDNNALMHELSAFHFEAEMDLEVGGGASQERFKLGMTGSGDLAMDASAAEGIDDMAEQAEAIIASLAGQMRFVFSMEEAGAEESIDLDMLMRDGIILLSGSLMDDMTGEMDWFGLDLNGAIGALLEQAGISDDLLQDRSDQTEPMPAITRLDDVVLNGASVAVFESTVDLDALMADSADAMDETMGMFGMEGMLGSGELTNRHYVGLEDGYSYRQELSGAFSVDGLSMEGATGDLEVAMSMTIDLSAFDEPVVVELPEDAPAFPLAMLLAMGSQ